MTAAVLDLPTDTTTSTDDQGPACHHIVVCTKADREAGLDAAAVVTRAYILGLPVLAFCGDTFIPSRDPRELPLCEACRDRLES